MTLEPSGPIRLMKLQRTPIALLVASLLAGLVLSLYVGEGSSKPPNLVVIVVDTLRADAVRTQLGNSETPHIAELASHGVVFSRAFTHAPMTLPAHASLFSGLHPFQTGVYNNGQDVPDDLPLLAETLQEEGYQTAAVVSLATLWPSANQLGIDRGFEVFDTGQLEVAPAEDASARLATVLDAMDPERPFFLFAHLSDPHEPYNEHAPWFEGSAQGSVAQAQLDGNDLGSTPTSSMSYWEADLVLGPGQHRFRLESSDSFKLRALDCSIDGVSIEPQWKQGQLLVPTSAVEIELNGPSTGSHTVHLRAWLNDTPSPAELRPRYASEVRAADAAIGELIAELKRRGQWEDTLVVLTADHGEALGEHGVVGHVVNLFDELLAVPLIIRLPGDQLDEGLVLESRGLVRHVDVLPTIHEALGLGLPEAHAGSSLFASADRLLIAQTHPPEAPRSLLAMRDETYKMVYDPLADSFELFRLGPDPLELDNVYAHQGHLRTSWELVLRRLASEVEPDVERDALTQSKLTALGY
jgi:membrane-anchored protein YejM (alkaline phosphatase superfamily)